MDNDYKTNQKPMNKISNLYNELTESPGQVEPEQ